MAVGFLYITEYAQSGVQNGQGRGVAYTPQILSQTRLDTSAGSTQSAVFGANTKLVRLHNDSGQACSILFGTNPTATTGNSRMAKNSTEYYAIEPTAKLKVAAVLSDVP